MLEESRRAGCVAGAWLAQGLGGGIKMGEGRIKEQNLSFIGVKSRLMTSS